MVVVFVVFVVVFAVVERQIVVFMKNNTNSWYRVISVSSPWMAAQYPLYREVEPFEQPVFSECFKSILRACRRESACGGSQWGYAYLIEPYQKYKRECHHLSGKCQYLILLQFHFR